MTEEEYQVAMKRGRELLAQLAAFPAHEVKAYSKEHHPEDREHAASLWAAYLEGTQ